MNQTKRHQPHGEMQPVPTLNKSFHTITIDWLVALPNEKDFEQLTTVRDKFDKGVLLIPGNARWKRPNGQVFIKKLVSHDWGVPSVIISDRDTSCLSVRAYARRNEMAHDVNKELIATYNWHSLAERIAQILCLGCSPGQRAGPDRNEGDYQELPGGILRTCTP